MVSGENSSCYITNLSEDEQTDNDSNSSDDFDNEIVLPDRNAPSFGSIAVTNSKDVHFGNKTFYQGPVTIKQFLYANGDDKNKPPLSEVPELALKSGDLTCDSVPSFAKGVPNPSFVPNGSESILTSPTPDKKVANTDDKDTRWFSPLSNKHFLFLSSTFVVLLIVVVVITTVLTLRDVSDTDADKTVNRPEDSDEQAIGTPIGYPLDSNLTLAGKVKIISRLEWLAQPPLEGTSKLVLPVPNVIIHHTATENCTSQAQCVFHVRFIQTFHIESRHWSDIGYNFLVGGDGFAYEGRGWKTEGAHLYGYNSRSIGIAFIGTFNNIKPPRRQIIACKRLIQKGVELGYLTKNYTIVTARQLQTTESPGLVLHNEVKTWAHWTPVPSP